MGQTVSPLFHFTLSCTSNSFSPSTYITSATYSLHVFLLLRPTYTSYIPETSDALSSSRYQRSSLHVQTIIDYSISRDVNLPLQSISHQVACSIPYQTSSFPLILLIIFYKLSMQKRIITNTCSLDWLVKV